ncbi:asparagine synthase-related protein, partial [Paraburkholderia sp. SIMBA_049]
FQHPLVKPRVTANGLRELLDMIKTPELTVYDGLLEVRPGDLIILDRSGLRKETYWRLQANEHRDDQQATIATVRDILSDTVQRQIVSDVPLCTLLSGGLDSSAVTA